MGCHVTQDQDAGSPPPPAGRAILAQRVAARALLPVAQADRHVRALVAQMAACLASGQALQLRGLGTLAPSGQARRRVVFRPGARLRAALARRAR